MTSTKIKRLLKMNEWMKSKTIYKWANLIEVILWGLKFLLQDQIGLHGSLRIWTYTLLMIRTGPRTGSSNSITGQNVRGGLGVWYQHGWSSNGISQKAVRERRQKRGRRDSSLPNATHDLAHQLMFTSLFNEQLWGEEILQPSWNTDSMDKYGHLNRVRSLSVAWCNYFAIQRAEIVMV